jgi:hypothetical protein
MNHENEARLDRSLRNQISAPRLDGRFDAAVWARIEAEETRAANPVPIESREQGLSRWLFMSNAVGGFVTVALCLYFGLRAFAGVDLGVTLTMPSIPAAFVQSAIAACGYLATVLVLGFVFAITPFGRRLRAHFY